MNRTGGYTGGVPAEALYLMPRSNYYTIIHLLINLSELLTMVGCFPLCYCVLIDIFILHSILEALVFLLMPALP